MPLIREDSTAYCLVLDILVQIRHTTLRIPHEERCVYCDLLVAIARKQQQSVYPLVMVDRIPSNEALSRAFREAS